MSDELRKTKEAIHNWIGMAYGVTVGTGTKTDSLDLLIDNCFHQALTAYKKELLSKARTFERLTGEKPSGEFELAIPLSAIQEDTTVTPDSENRNNDLKETRQGSVTMPENTRSSELREDYCYWCRQYESSGFCMSCGNEIGSLPPEIEAYIASKVEEAETRIRHDIASQAPPCRHGIKDAKEHEAYCGFINSIWVNWAVKNDKALQSKEGYS